MLYRQPKRRQARPSTVSRAATSTTTSAIGAGMGAAAVSREKEATKKAKRSLDCMAIKALRSGCEGVE